MIQRIRPIAICVVRSGPRFLVSVDYDTQKGTSYARPLGGGIEFGEHSRDAVVREMHEEIGAEIINVRLLGVLENRFTLDGESAHEHVFVYEADLADAALYERAAIAGYETDLDTPFSALWLTLDEMKTQNIRFVPEGLLELC